MIQIDAFADALFEGNPAAVMPLPHWPADELLQRIAAEKNLSETAFVVAALPEGVEAPEPGCPAYHLRWFTPAIEVDLCGHATLAAASYLLDSVHPDATRVQLWTRSGWLHVDRAGEGGPHGGFTMDLPAVPLAVTDIDPVVTAALGASATEAYAGMDLVYVLEDAATVRELAPDLAVLAGLDTRGVVVTAGGRGSEFDFVCRWFGSRAGVSEDPVTGSAFAQIAPLWAQRSGKAELVGRQLSARGGTVRCRVVDGARVELTGNCIRFSEGVAAVPGLT
ncbi:PhzF family phenazine biosynthesis protein [Rhodococcus sp. D2-41]|nr:PhzF family phenazine biosynthesis protein [Rhodococcus sp. D2-41]